MPTLKIDREAILYPFEPPVQRLVEQIAWRRPPTLVVVHSRELLEQWISYVDIQVGVLENAAQVRRRVYEAA